jgi:hypothetical protein
MSGDTINQTDHAFSSGGTAVPVALSARLCDAVKAAGCWVAGGSLRSAPEGDAVSAQMWSTLLLCLGIAALAYAFATSRTPNNLYPSDRATHPVAFWVDVSGWVAVVVFGAVLLALGR